MRAGSTALAGLSAPVFLLGGWRRVIIRRQGDARTGGQSEDRHQ